MKKAKKIDVLPLVGTCICGHDMVEHVPSDEGTTQPCSECECPSFSVRG